MLCVPAIAKNLVSTSKLAQDNSIYSEFHGDYCVVKDKRTDRMVLKGTLRDGLYKHDDAEVKPIDGRGKMFLNNLCTKITVQQH